MVVGSDIDDFCKMYMDTYIGLENELDKEDYINEFIKPMIVDGWLYEINNFQCAPYLPKEVDNIELLTEKECLEFLLEKTEF